ncbi:Multidrug ATP-binding cassette transporters (ABC) transporter [Teratosphaeria destructans]|uniref:Multidrug ATP-binding cassette transporters (ABC) transporter n=1 Tax=Teratosphaeria destructans TaxID=418781 RepID=A0A9W7W1M5_9PEZI|nr:Multidrug ATP-binding cassette transporters (ABC) transporter [Teratosphaeria destructans]
MEQARERHSFATTRSAPSAEDAHEPDQGIRRTSTAIGEFGESTLDPAHPRAWHAPVTALSAKAYRQLLGLNPFKSSYISLFSVLEGISEKSLICIGVVSSVAAGVPLPIIGVIFGRLISSFPPSEQQLTLRISQLLGVAAAYFAVTAIYATAWGFVGEKVAIRMRKRLLRCLLYLDQAYLDTHDLDVNSLLTEKIDSIHAGCSEKIGIFIQSISYFVAAFVVGFILSPKLAGILIAAVVPTMIMIVSITSRLASKLSKRVAEHQEAANAIVESALRAVKVIQAFDMVSELCAIHFQYSHAALKVSTRRSLVSAVQIGSIFFTAYAINALAFYVGSQMAHRGEGGGDAGTIFAVVLLILDSSFVVAQFAPFVDIFAKAASAGETIQDLLDETVGDATEKIVTHGKSNGDLTGLPLEFTSVHFAYPARPTAPVLQGLNLTIAPSSFTAIVGTSGGGKSTLISLLTGIYEYQGHIRVGTDELRDLELSDVRSQMAVVEQEAVLFSGTIYENVCSALWGRGIPDEELQSRCTQALKDAAVNFLDELPLGVHTPLGDGVQLSGGQKQRICLARALIRKPAVLILDEPTSALDARSEVAVVEAVKKAAASGITVVMVAHRLSTVLEADSVAVFSDGNVVEQGSPRELVDSRGVFRGLLEAQNTTLDDQALSGKTSETSLEKVASHSTKPAIGGPVHEDDVSGHPPKAKAKDSNDNKSKALLLRLVVRPDWYFIVLGVFAAMLSGALLIGEAIVFGNLVQLLNGKVHSPTFTHDADFFCLMFFVLACVALVSWIGSGTSFGVASARSVVRIQSRLLARILTLDMDWFSDEGRSVHQLMSAFTKDSGDLSSMSGTALGTIFTTITSVCGGLILALCVSWRISVVLLAAVPVMLAAGFTRLRVLHGADSRRRATYRQATSLAAEACRSRRTVTVFGLEPRILSQYDRTLQEAYHRSRPFIAVANVLLALALAITYFVYALAYWWGAKQVRQSHASGKEFFTVLPALLFSAQSAGQLFSLSPEIARAKAASKSIADLLSHRSSILRSNLSSDKLSTTTPGTEAKPPQDQLGCGQSSSSGDIPKLAFDHVSFAYGHENSKPVLHDTCVEVRQGQTIALVGPSGAGKSSVISLIERFYDPLSGTVRLDGQDIRSMDVKRLRDRMGLVSQEPDLLPGSISYNVRLGARHDQEISEADIADVCKQCGLHDFITSLPDGYNTECGSTGASKLSGGQRQRLAIARALIRQPEMLLLDEVTSALDAHSERIVQDSLAAATQDRTTIMVAHRLASIQHADRIYVLDNGRVVESGTHAELMRNGLLYASLAKTQKVC